MATMFAVCVKYQKIFSPHFMSCSSYESEAYNINWKVIFGNDIKTQIKIAFIAQKRLKEREMRQEESVHDSYRGFNAPVIC